MTKPGSFPWAPGKNLPHPDAEAIIAWARGLAHLDIIHVPKQGDLTVEGVWMPSEFPTMNPACKRVRIRPERKMACIYRYKESVERFPEKPLMVPENETAKWDAKNPDKIRLTNWAFVLEV